MSFLRGTQHHHSTYSARNAALETPWNSFLDARIATNDQPSTGHLLGHGLPFAGTSHRITWGAGNQESDQQRICSTQ
jgi:hypothetical protein